MKLKRVFSIVPDCHADAAPYAGLWRRHFYEGLQQAVERLILPANINFTWARAENAGGTVASEQRAVTSEVLWKQLRDAIDHKSIDAVISYCRAGDLELELVKRTIQLGIPWVNFFCD